MGPPRGRRLLQRKRVKAAPVLRSRSILALTASTCLWSRSRRFLAALRMCLGTVNHHIVYHPFIPTGKVHSRSLDVAELGSLDLDSGIALEGGGTDFTANVFSFTIAIRPDKERRTVPCLCLNIFGNFFLVLFFHVSTCTLCQSHSGPITVHRIPNSPQQRR